MQKTKESNKMKGFRPPSEEEIRCISRHMQAYYCENGRQTKVIGMVLAVTGMLLMAGGLSSRSLPAIVTGVVFFAVAASAFLSAEKNEKGAARFGGGAFRVLDGSVSRIQMCPELPGISSVEFTSDAGQVYEGWFEVRNEDLKIGTPLLLVYIPGKEMMGGKFLWAFTPFMLTEEGAKKHR